MSSLKDIKRILFEQEDEDITPQGVLDAEEAISQLFDDGDNNIEHEDIQDFLDDEQNKEAAGGEENLNYAWQNIIDFGLVRREGNNWIWVEQDDTNFDVPMESNLQEVPLRKVNKIRGGKVIRKAFTAAKKGFRAVRKAGGKTARIVIQKGSEKLKRKLGAIKSAKARRAKKAIIKRKTGISKRKGIRTFGKSTRSFSA